MESEYDKRARQKAEYMLALKQQKTARENSNLSLLKPLPHLQFQIKLLL